MAHDEKLAGRVRAILAAERDVVEKKLMGKLAFMVNGKLAYTVGPVGLLVRVTPASRATLLAKDNVSPMEMRGRIMQGFVRVASAGLRSKASLSAWVGRGVDAAAEKEHPGTKRSTQSRTKKPASTKATSSIDAYLRRVSPAHVAALEDLRRKIHRVLPNVQECLSYGIPAFRCDDSIVAGFAATRNGCSYYPFSGTTLKTVAPFVRNYEQTKSALHFRVDAPLPLALVRRLIRARRAEG